MGVPQDIINQINADIVTNGNNDITAIVLNPILVAMVQQYIDYLGDLSTLTTTEKTNLVGAINEVAAAFSGINDVVQGSGISIDKTDPANPIISIGAILSSNTTNDSSVKGATVKDALDFLLEFTSESTGILEWNFDTTTTKSQPSNGFLRFDNSTPASVTEIFIAATNDNSQDANEILRTLNIDDIVYIQQASDPAKYLMMKLSAAITDETGWYTIAGSIEDSGTLIDNNAPLVFTIIKGNAVSNVGLASLDADFSDIMDLINGSALDSPSVTITESAGTVYLNLEKSGGGDIRYKFSDGLHIHDCTPIAQVSLTAGSDTVPQINYIYILQSNKTLTVSTTGFPTDEHAPVATVVCPSASRVSTDGVYKIHGWSDHIRNTDLQGHLAHINYWIRQQPATWKSGAALTPTVNDLTPDTIDISTTAGIILQLHEKTFPAFDTATGSKLWIYNDFNTPYDPKTKLTDAAEDDGGNAIQNNNWINWVIWGVVNNNTSECKLMVNLPSGFHGSALAATQDVERYSNYTIPTEYRGVGFLIARVTCKYASGGGGVWTVEENLDLRGANVAGGGTSGLGSDEFPDNLFKLLDNLDPTKKLSFQVANVTAGQERTLTVPDDDGTIAVAINTGGLTDEIPDNAGVITLDEFYASAFKIRVGAIDASFMVFDLNALPTSTTRTVFMPDRNVDLENVLQTFDVTLSASEIKNINTTPKQLVAAKGANTWIEPIAIAWFFDYTAPVFDTNPLDIEIVGSTTAFGSVSASVIGGSADAVGRLDMTKGTTGQFVANADLEVSGLNSIQTGGGTLRIWGTYRVIDVS